MRIETERLAVRGFALEDEADLHEILGDAQTMRFLEAPYDREKTQRFLAEFCIARRGAMAAQRKDSGKVIGYILLREEAPGVLEMGWVFHRAHWGQGYAQEACRAALDAAFAQRGAHKVLCRNHRRGPVRAPYAQARHGLRGRAACAGARAIGGMGGPAPVRNPAGGVVRAAGLRLPRNLSVAFGDVGRAPFL